MKVVHFVKPENYCNTVAEWDEKYPESNSEVSRKNTARFFQKNIERRKKK